MTQITIDPKKLGGGSLQNPSWSPDGKMLCLTRWMSGYNEPPARVLVYDLVTKKHSVIANGKGVTNCSQPGSCWHPTSGIIFSSDRWGDDNDQVCRCTLLGDPDIERLTQMPGYQGSEPSWHPDGVQFCFQQNKKDKDRGRIMLGHIGSFELTPFGLSDGDNRQPNLSPDGKSIVYQRLIRKDWWLYVGAFQLVKGTDATWHPDGRILYSDEDGRLRLLDISTLKYTRVGPQSGYHGAPSVSPDGMQIACEASDRDPDGGPGTWIEIFPVST